jgi:predicted amidohydrolase
MRVAVAKYRIEAPADFDAFAARQRALLGDAARAGARLAVLPEYLSLELAATFDAAVRGDLHASLAATQAHRDAFLALYAGLARELGLVVQAGTFLTDVGGRYRNRAWWFAPDGRAGFQDKLQLTGFEKQAGVIEGGDALHVFDAGGLRAGIGVCYDIEFPLPVRAQAEAGARLLLVPSCTDTEAGATRVRVGCLARALENRVFVAQAVTAGDAPWSPALDVNTGDAALYAPMDRGLPADGIVARTRGDEAWAVADLDIEALDAHRAQAQVANDHDWPGQLRPSIARARLDVGMPARDAGG